MAFNPSQPTNKQNGVNRPFNRSAVMYETEGSLSSKPASNPGIELVSDSIMENHNSWNDFLAPKNEEPKNSEVFVQPDVTNVEFKSLFDKGQLEKPTMEETFENRDLYIGNQKEISNFSMLTAKVAQPAERNSEFLSNKKEASLIEYIDFGLLVVESTKAMKWLKAGANEAMSAVRELFLDYVFFGFGKKEATKNPQQIEKEQKEMAEAAKKRSFYDSLRGMSRSLQSMLMIKGRREEINRKMEANNLLFEGFVGESGEVRTDVEAALERANSELEKKQIQAKRQKQLARVGAGKGKSQKGPGVSINLNKATEDPNNVTKLLG